MVGEALDVARRAALAQQLRDHRVRPGRAAETEVDAAGSERLERRELLGDDERRVVRQHDAARAEADPRGAGGGGRGTAPAASSRRPPACCGARRTSSGGSPSRSAASTRERDAATACALVCPVRTGTRSRTDRERADGRSLQRSSRDATARPCPPHSGGRAIRRVARIRRQGIRFVATRQDIRDPRLDDAAALRAGGCPSRGSRATRRRSGAPRTRAGRAPAATTR